MPYEPYPALRRIVASSPDWHLSGVNVFTSRLFREVSIMGWDPTIVLTNPERASREITAEPSDLRVIRLHPTHNREWAERQSRLREQLLLRAPCVYLPNYDFDSAGMLPTLPKEVITLGILHSDEDIYYRFIEELGPWMDVVIAVSERIEDEVRTRIPSVADRLVRIPYGVPSQRAIVTKPPPSPLRVLYAGRISQAQKRILDLGAIAAQCAAENLPIQFDIAGDGPELPALRELLARAAPHTTKLHGAVSPEEVNLLAASAHVLMLTSEFEGLPVVLLEAMETGCVPVVTDIRSGVRELVLHEETGLLFPVGDITAAVAALKRLVRSPNELHDYSIASHARFVTSDYSLRTVAKKYLAVIDRAWNRKMNGEFAPPMQGAFVPRHHRFGPRVKARLKRMLGMK